MRPLFLAVLIVAAAAPSVAQGLGSVPPRYGVGFDAAVPLPGQDLVPSGPSIGIRGRVALPVNADVSVAASLGMAAHLFGGQDETRYVLNPQASVIVTLPGEGTARYVLGGFGAFLPFSDGGGGPALHVGAGWAIPLNETSLYVEANPSLVVGDSETTAVLAVRAGVIF